MVELRFTFKYKSFVVCIFKETAIPAPSTKATIFLSEDAGYFLST